MNSKSFLRNDNAVSISIGFILMFTVTVLMFTALILSFFTLTQQTEKAAMQETFKMIGSGLAIKLTTVDTLVNITGSYGGTIEKLEYEITMPASIAGKSYTVNITGNDEIILGADNGARKVVPLNMSTNFTERTIYSGAENYKLLYNKSTNSINIVEI